MPYIVLFASRRGLGPEGIDRLSQTLGRAGFEVRQWTVQGIPRVIARVGSSSEVATWTSALRDAGFDADVVDEDRVRSTASVARGRIVRLREDALEVDGVTLPYREVCALVRVRMPRGASGSSVQVERVTSERGHSVTVATQRSERGRGPEEALVVFDASGPRWILAQSALRYAALGLPLRPTQRENFDDFTAMLRVRVAPDRYDDALCAEGSRDGPSEDARAAMDATIHAIAPRRAGATHPMR
jgi:hypothetical protein